MIFPANIAVEQRVMMVAIVIAFFIFTRFRYTPSHVQSKPSSYFSLRQGLQSSLSEGHISSCTIVRRPDILHMFLDMLQCTKSTNFSHMYYFFIIHKMSLRRNEIISRAGFGRWAVVLRPLVSGTDSRSCRFQNPTWTENLYIYYHKLVYTVYYHNLYIYTNLLPK